MPLICFLFSAYVPQEKVNHGFFSVKFSTKIYRYAPYGYCAVLDSVSFWDVENSKVEAHFLKKLDFVTNKCLAQDALGKCPGTIENLSKYTVFPLSQYIVMCTNFLIISCILQSYPNKWAISVNEMRCPYKQSLS